jgi:TPR repeat protein
LGYYYTVGHGSLKPDPAQAAYWYGKAAEQGHEEAKKTLADLNAYMPVKEKAEAGNAEAQYQMGLWMSEGGNELVGLSYNAAGWFLKAAEQGHGKAKEELGAILKDPGHWNSAILSMMTEKAEAGDAGAQHDLGRYYTKEQIFLPRPTHLENMDQAIKWFGLAALQGHKEAKEKLALLTSLKTTYEKAKGGAQQSTASSGVDEKNQHGVAHNNGLQDEQKREDFSPSSAPGDMDAQYQIGVWQSEGGNEMVCKDGLNATIWFGKAAEQGHREAKEKLDELNKNPRNWNSGKLISTRRKAEDTDAEAQYQMGLWYYEHSHSTGRYTEAIGLFNKAAAQGHEGAAAVLAKLKQEGNEE